MKKSILLLALLVWAAGASAQVKSATPTQLPNGASASWWELAQKNIRESEYHIRPKGDGMFSSPNRAQNLRFAYSERGFCATRRDSLAPLWQAEVRYIGVSKEQAFQPDDAPFQLSADANTLTATSDGLLMRYRNDEKGMRQDFIVKKKPAGNVPLRLWLEARMSGGKVEVKPDAVSFLTESGAEAMRYSDLKVWDANQRRLAARFEREGERFAIVVNDKSAAYPITIDPLSTTPNWTAESNQAFAQFGYSVASAGDVNGDGFSDVIVGALGFDNGETDEGRAFVYHGSSSGLSATANWTAESNQLNAQFGYSVASAGDVNGDGFSDVIVGARFFDNIENNEGRAFVYHGSASGLSTTANWTAESNQANAQFGISVASAGDVNGDGFSDVIVGARFFDNIENNEGRAFVYHGSSSGLSTTANWTAESNQANAQFGISVASAGDVNGDGFSDVIVGALGFDNGQTDEGAAFVYHGSSTGLSTTVNWTAESNQANAQFGISVASAGDVNGDGFSDVIVGADLFDNGQTDEGAAFVYHGSSSGLSTTANWTAESNQANAQFGISVASAGDVNGDGFSDVIVGADLFDNGQTDEGAAFVFHGSASGLSTTANWTAESNQAFAYFGISVASAGDVNGDGFSDVIVGAYFFDNGETEGAAFVYHGNAGGGFRQDLRQFRPSTTTPIVPALKTQSLAGVTLRKRQKSIAGRSNTKIQIEVKPLGTPFNGTGLQETSFALHALIGTPTDLTISGLLNQTLYKWRVRQVERPSGIGYILLPRSRWYYPAGVAPTESHFKVGENDYVGPTAGITPGSYGNVTLTAGGNLPGNVAASGTLTLNSGVVCNLNGNAIAVTNSASGAIAGMGFLTGSGSLTRAFNGNNAYAFPYSQSGNNRSATVTFTSGAGTGTLNFQFFNTPPGNAGLPQTFVGQNIAVTAPYFWRIDATGAPGTYTLSLRALNTDGVTDVSTLRIVKRPNAGSWSSTGAGTGSSNTGTAADPTVAQSGMTGFSEFSIGGSGVDNPLPVELSAFTGSATREGVRLSWTTASERNNAGFEVRRSENGGEFQTIASHQFSPELKGKGTTTNATNYAFLDINVEAGKTYAYRLRSVDYDATIHDYAQTVTVEVREPVATKVYEYALEQNYPNPFNPTTVIRFTMKEAGRATLTVTDILGRVVLRETMQARVGENAYRFNAVNLGSGAYFYTLRAGNFQQTKKMMLVK